MGHPLVLAPVVPPDVLPQLVAHARRDALRAGSHVTYEALSAEVLRLLGHRWMDELGLPPLDSCRELVSVRDVDRRLSLFIDCYFEGREVATLCDLQRALCAAEGVGDYEQLQMGPLTAHPAVRLRFGGACPAVPPDVTAQEVLGLLAGLLRAAPSGGQQAPGRTAPGGGSRRPLSFNERLEEQLIAVRR